ncbi:aspartyl/glutamyl-tRNA(Asn/Gln) amidotransferase subunit B [Arachidicoccus rhizosphaerae]|uniref:Aspartyl/glutamyl-tRNA(Asn/Gln) amidotransferase subunit B n=1 Tax=Arachidicoccus rhizosphaerae TaxID=551991 RepID=A0A1H3ZL58_9BACT|nr:Asp-tRNA(Asn)/Glu-tRNA(Gln) amidotransferase subunit GatB [Arachidicoccus rhizosphaerae]SEA24410.1 aspartyl/glutamyl-tRNA(Asn/Gln) amidotransferase subunit B [Arachidicoccus rhizosphaerae]
MATIYQGKYEAVIGLEIHVQLDTASKLFCADSTKFGAEPNTHISPITLALPGTLPKINKKAIEYAVRLGLACQCEIMPYNFFARKNYFYPDLPKGWQTTQHTHPICMGGLVPIKTQTGIRQVQMHHIHLEEDAGKSIHDIYEGESCVDLNRAGTALVEIVSEPDMFSADEAWNYVQELRRLVRWIGVSDANMEEGSLRCDANISIRPAGDTRLGTRVEVKNLNSTRNIKKAIDFEIDRMIRLVEAGGMVQQQTRSFDAATGTTFAIRDKEQANDYRYFPEPDLPPIQLSQSFIEQIRASMPALPQQLAHKYQTSFGLSPYDAEQLVSDKDIAVYFEAATQKTNQYKAVANWINGPIRSIINEEHLSIDQVGITPETLADIIQLVDTGKLNFSVASTRLLPALRTPGADQKGQSALDIATRLNLIQTDNEDLLETWINEALESMPDKVQAYQKGKKGLIGLFVGEVKKRSKGKADPGRVMDLIKEKLG